MAKAKRMLWIILFSIVGTYVLLAMFMYISQERLLYFPSKEIDANPKDAGLPYQEVFFQAADGTKLWGWFIDTPNSLGVILYCHGNAGNITHRLESLRMFYQMQLQCFIFDYRGYGKSEGSPQEHGTYQDVEAAWKYLVEEKKISPEKIFVFGRSMGGPIAAYIASQKKPGALILESTFTSVPELASELYPLMPIKFLARIRYPTKSYLERTLCPVLVFHSKDDELVPYSHGKKLFEIAKEPKDFMEMRGGHNNGFLLLEKAYMAKWKNFLENHVLPKK